MRSPLAASRSVRLRHGAEWSSSPLFPRAPRPTRDARSLRMSRWLVRLGSHASRPLLPASADGLLVAERRAGRRARRSPSPASRPTIARSRSRRAATSGRCPSTGGVARLLVSHPANESRPLYSPDGKRLAFISTRTGGGDIYVLTFATGDLAPPDVRRRASTSSTRGRPTASGCTSRRRAARSPA